MKLLLACVLLLGCALDVHEIHAANLVTNADFSEGFSAWSSFNGSFDPAAITPCSSGSECGIFQHDALDDCCGQSPAAEVRATSAFFATQALVQCVASIAANSAYDYGAWMRITTAPGPQPGVPNVLVLWYPSTDCSGSPSAFPQSAQTESPTWMRAAVSGVFSPADSQSALVMLSAGPYGDSGTPVGMAFDGVFFGPSGTVPVELQSFFVE